MKLKVMTFVSGSLVAMSIHAQAGQTFYGYSYGQPNQVEAEAAAKRDAMRSSQSDCTSGRCHLCIASTLPRVTSTTQSKSGNGYDSVAVMRADILECTGE